MPDLKDLKIGETQVLASDAKKDNKIKELAKSWFHEHLDDTNIPHKIMQDIIEDVYETADPDHWNEDDVFLACQRAIKDKLGMYN